MRRSDLDPLHRKVDAKAPGSALLHRRTRELLPDPSCGTLNMLHPIYIRSAKGSHVVDVDGNDYIDLVMGYGPHVLGHAPEVALEAARDALNNGMQWAMHSPYQEPLAQLISAAYPSNEMVLFCNSGTEATMHAMRLARAFSGKTLVAIFDGGYHGAHDYVMVDADPASPRTALQMVPRCAGLPAETLSTMRMLPYWDDTAFEMIRNLRSELAAVLVEPVQGPSPQMGQGEWLKGLRQVCDECGVLLIFDEVISGFRLGYGGAQEMFAVPADITTYGKVIGGGLPNGAVAGRRDVMELFAPRPPKGPVVASAGSFSGNPMSMATGTAVLRHLRDHPEIYTQLREQSQRLIEGLNRVFDENSVPAEMRHAHSVLSLRLRPSEPTTDPDAEEAWAVLGDAVQLKLLERGIIVPGAHQFYLSSAHTEQDVDQLIESFGAVMTEVRDEGFIPSSTVGAPA